MRFLRKVSSHRAGRTVTVLGDDDLGDPRLVVGVVVVGPMDQEHDVGVLLDRTGLTKVGHDEDDGLRGFRHLG